MNKPFVKNVLAVVLGICLITEIFSLVTLIPNAAQANNLILHAGTDEDLTQFIRLAQWTSVALICLISVTLVCFALTFFTKNAVFCIAASALCLLLAATALAFYGVTDKVAMNMLNANVYAAATEFEGDLLTVAVPAVIICVYYAFSAATAFKRRSMKNETEA